MPYYRANELLRRTLQAEFMGAARLPAAASRSYTLHGLKATLLSYARQLDVDESCCADQGHHRTTPGRASVRLYGRDDVFGASCSGRTSRRSPVASAR